MKIVKAAVASAGIAMLAAQPVAAANPAQKLSLTKAVKADVRASSKAGKSKQAEGVATGLIIAGVVAAAVVTYLVVDGSGSDSN